MRQCASFAKETAKHSKLTSKGKPTFETLLSESSNSQLLAKLQGFWDENSVTNNGFVSFR